MRVVVLVCVFLALSALSAQALDRRRLRSHGRLHARTRILSADAPKGCTAGGSYCNGEDMCCSKNDPHSYKKADKWEAACVPVTARPHGGCPNKDKPFHYAPGDSKDGGVVPHQQDYRFKFAAKIPAGTSMGNVADRFYWTLGAVLCDSKGNKYGLTNAHNKDTQPAGAAVSQPSQNNVDKTLNKEAARAVGKWTDVVDDWPNDIALFKFDDASVATNQVLGPAGKLYTVAGHVTDVELAALKADSEIFISSRMCGWCGLKFKGFGGSEMMGPDVKYVKVPVETEKGSENPNILAPGNSGSGLWLRNGDTVKLIGIYSGSPDTNPSTDRILDTLKVGGERLTVCTA